MQDRQLDFMANISRGMQSLQRSFSSFSGSLYNGLTDGYRRTTRSTNSFANDITRGLRPVRQELDSLTASTRGWINQSSGMSQIRSSLGQIRAEMNHMRRSPGFVGLNTFFGSAKNKIKSWVTHSQLFTKAISLMTRNINRDVNRANIRDPILRQMDDLARQAEKKAKQGILGKLFGGAGMLGMGVGAVGASAINKTTGAINDASASADTIIEKLNKMTQILGLSSKADIQGINRQVNELAKSYFNLTKGAYGYENTLDEINDTLQGVPSKNMELIGYLTQQKIIAKKVLGGVSDEVEKWQYDLLNSGSMTKEGIAGITRTLSDAGRSWSVNGAELSTVLVGLGTDFTNFLTFQKKFSNVDISNMYKGVAGASGMLKYVGLDPSDFLKKFIESTKSEVSKQDFLGGALSNKYSQSDMTNALKDPMKLNAMIKDMLIERSKMVTQYGSSNVTKELAESYGIASEDIGKYANLQSKLVDINEKNIMYQRELNDGVSDFSKIQGIINAQSVPFMERLKNWASLQSILGVSMSDVAGQMQELDFYKIGAGVFLLTKLLGTAAGAMWTLGKTFLGVGASMVGFLTKSIFGETLTAIISRRLSAWLAMHFGTEAAMTAATVAGAAARTTAEAGAIVAGTAAVAGASVAREAVVTQVSVSTAAVGGAATGAARNAANTSAIIGSTVGAANAGAATSLATAGAGAGAGAIVAAGAPAAGGILGKLGKLGAGKIGLIGTAITALSSIATIASSDNKVQTGMSEGGSILGSVAGLAGAAAIGLTGPIGIAAAIALPLLGGVIGRKLADTAYDTVAGGVDSVGEGVATAAQQIIPGMGGKSVAEIQAQASVDMSTMTSSFMNTLPDILKGSIDNQTKELSAVMSDGLNIESADIYKANIANAINKNSKFGTRTEFKDSRYTNADFTGATIGTKPVELPKGVTTEQGNYGVPLFNAPNGSGGSTPVYKNVQTYSDDELTPVDTSKAMMGMAVTPQEIELLKSNLVSQNILGKNQEKYLSDAAWVSQSLNRDVKVVESVVSQSAEVINTAEAIVSSSFPDPSDIRSAIVRGEGGAEVDWDKYSKGTSAVVSSREDFDNKYNDYQKTLQGDSSNTMGAEFLASGGMINNPTLSMVGEAGPEAVIPLSADKRDRGMSLWLQAGRALGVMGYEDGVVTGETTESNIVEAKSMFGFGKTTVGAIGKGAKGLQQASNVIAFMADNGNNIDDAVNSIEVTAFAGQPMPAIFTQIAPYMKKIGGVSDKLFGMNLAMIAAQGILPEGSELFTTMGLADESGGTDIKGMPGREVAKEFVKAGLKQAVSKGINAVLLDVIPTVTAGAATAGGAATASIAVPIAAALGAGIVLSKMVDDGFNQYDKNYGVPERAVLARMEELLPGSSTGEGTRSYESIRPIAEEQIYGARADAYANSIYAGYVDPLFGAYANGGLIDSTKIAMMGEAGPEMVIPLSSDKRSQAMDLWIQAGRMMGVTGYEDGGLLGSSTKLQAGGPSANAAAIQAYMTKRGGYKGVNIGQIIFDEAQKYGIDPAFLAAISIQETGFGTTSSSIFQQKNNLFGYGANDSDPGNLAKSYGGSIEEAYRGSVVAAAKQIAEKDYYYKAGNETLGGIGNKWASDKDWSKKVGQYWYEMASGKVGPSGGAASYPVSDKLLNYKTTAGFGSKKLAVWGADGHDGTDFAINAGTSLGSPVEGIVSKIGSDNSYGDYIEIKGPGGETYKFAHMSEISAREGQKLGMEEVFGKSGGVKGAKGAGNSEGAHLHMEVISNEGKKVNPEAWLKGSMDRGIISQAIKATQSQDLMSQVGAAGINSGKFLTEFFKGNGPVKSPDSALIESIESQYRATGGDENKLNQLTDNNFGLSSPYSVVPPKVSILPSINNLPDNVDTSTTDNSVFEKIVDNVVNSSDDLGSDFSSDGIENKQSETNTLLNNLNALMADLLMIIKNRGGSISPDGLVAFREMG